MTYVMVAMDLLKVGQQKEVKFRFIDNYQPLCLTVLCLLRKEMSVLQ